MKRMIILAFAALVAYGVFSPVAPATETAIRPGNEKQITQDPRRRPPPRGGRDRRRRGNSFSFGLNLGGPGYHPGYYSGYSSRPVMVCDAYGNCWYQYR